jgi:hypothetical protein
MSKVIVSGLKARPLVTIMGLGAALGAYMLSSDTAGHGLNETMFYKGLGNLIYPVFYGALATGLWQIASMFLRRADYLAVQGDLVSVGSKEVPRSDISGVTLQHTSLVSELVLHRRSGSDIVIKSYMLSRPASEVQAHLHSLIFKPDALTV